MEKNGSGHKKMRMQSVVTNIVVIGAFLTMNYGFSIAAFTSKIVMSETVLIAFIGMISNIVSIFLGMKIGQALKSKEEVENKDI